eukprot:m.128337 g.128337  ORF g.128337 m.128337 type:complete len:200 (+) comp14729_c0_seq2:279-878(+)
MSVALDERVRAPGRVEPPSTEEQRLAKYIISNLHMLSAIPHHSSVATALNPPTTTASTSSAAAPAATTASSFNLASAQTHSTTAAASTGVGAVTAGGGSGGGVSRVGDTPPSLAARLSVPAVPGGTSTAHSPLAAHTASMLAASPLGTVRDGSDLLPLNPLFFQDFLCLNFFSAHGCHDTAASVCRPQHGPHSRSLCTC